MRRILLPQGNNYKLALCPVPINDYSFQRSETSKTFLLQFTESKPGHKYSPVIPEWNVFLKDNHVEEEYLGRKEVHYAEYQEYLRRKYGTGRHKGSHSILVWIAATSLILIFAIISVFNHLTLKDTTVLFNRYYKAPAVTELLNNINQLNDMNLKLSAYYFQKGDFLNAGNYSNVVSQTSSGFYVAKLLSAICLIENNEYLEALEKLDISSKNSGIIPYFQWYSGLCNLKLGRISNARYFFNELNNSSHFLKKNAAKILEELDSLH